MARDIKSGDAPLTILGAELKEGDKAPEFTLSDNELQPKHLSDYLGKPVIMSIVPSVDTPVCNIQTRRFNQEASRLPGVNFLTISKDLPFAQKRWCAAAGADKVVTLSDYRNSGFALDYGVLIKELFLLTRAVFVLDKDGVIKLIDFVPDISKEPDYAAVLAAAKKLA